MTPGSHEHSGDHSHEHTHADGTTHSHPHSHEGDHRHHHADAAPTDSSPRRDKRTAADLPPEPTQQGDGQEAGTARPEHLEGEDR